MRPDPLPMGVRQAEGTLTFETKTSTYGWTCRICYQWNPPGVNNCLTCNPDGIKTALPNREALIGIALLALVQAAETGAIDLAGEIRDLAYHLGAT